MTSHRCLLLLFNNFRYLQYYYAPDGRRFRSRNQVERFLFDQRGSVSSLGGKKEISKRELEGTDQAGDGGGDAMEAVETAAPDGLGISITEGIQGTDQSQQHRRYETCESHATRASCFAS